MQLLRSNAPGWLVAAALSAATLLLQVPSASAACQQCSPAEPVEAARWGELEPRAILGDTTWYTFHHEPACSEDMFHAVDAEEGFLFAATGNQVKIWNANSNPGSPSVATVLCRPVLGTFNKSDKDFYFVAIDAPEGDSSVVAAGVLGGMGIVVIDARSKAGAKTIFQEEHFNGEDVFATRAGTTGRRLAFAATGFSGVRAYDLDAALGLTSPCLLPGGSCGGVSLGNVNGPTTAQRVHGVGDYLAVVPRVGAVDIWRIAPNPTNPTRVWSGPGMRDVAMWASGGKHYLAGISSTLSSHVTSIFDVSCIAQGSCAGSPQPIKTLVTPVASNNQGRISVSQSGGSTFLYVGSVESFQGGPNREYLIDVTAPLAARDLSPPRYWEWYYTGNDTGFNSVGPYDGVVSDGHLYRAGFSMFDVHEIVGGSSAPPAAGFTWSPSTIYPGVPVTFTDTSIGFVESWSWAFPGGTPPSSTVESPVVTFTGPGKPLVGLEVANAAGSSSADQAVEVLDPTPAIGAVAPNVSAAPVCSTVTFTATGLTGQPPLSLSWQVLDPNGQPVGSPVTHANPYPWVIPQQQPPGDYTVAVTATGVGTSPVVESAPVDVQVLPDLAIDVQPTLADLSLGSATFAVTTTGATSWEWDFGEGGLTCPAGFTKTAASTCLTTDPVKGKNPTHNYSATGTYEVTVTVDNCRDGELTSAPVEVVVVEVVQLVAGFAAQGICTSTFGCFADTGAAVSFADQSSGEPTAWAYDWNHKGDSEDDCTFGADQSTATTSHTWTQKGEFRPCLRVKRGAQVDVFIHQAISVGDPPSPPPPPPPPPPTPPPPPPPTGGGALAARFTVSPATPEVGQQVQLNAGTSTGNPTGYQWSFGDGSPPKFGRTTDHTYAAIGNYTVTLIVSRAQAGCDPLQHVCAQDVAQTTQQVIVVPGAAPPPVFAAAFTVSPEEPEAGQQITFDGTASTGAPSSFTWSFGDGTPDAGGGSVATHTYANPGTYTVRLTVGKAQEGCNPLAVDCGQQTAVSEKQVVVTGEPLCPPGQLCLMDGRFRVSVGWSNQHASNLQGDGRPIADPENPTTGFFWFFEPETIDLLVKAIDGGPVNGKVWFFYGALSDVEYDILVEDTESGEVKVYSNTAGHICGRADTAAFSSTSTAASLAGAAAATRSIGAADEQETVLRLLDGRFEVTLDFVDQHHDNARGAGKVITGTDKSGYFWFFQPDNLEMVVKMIDARSFDGTFWVFWGGLTDLEFTLRVKDTATGEVREYQNPRNTICGGADTRAFLG